jgi:hypothetical protein
MWGPAPAELLSELDALITYRLFGPGTWLSNRETGCAMRDRLHGMNLEEEVGDGLGTWRATDLGRHVNFELLCVFLGEWEPWDAVMILEKCELIDQWEAWTLYDGLATQKDPERLMRKTVQSAYRKYFGCRLTN